MGQPVEPFGAEGLPTSNAAILPPVDEFIVGVRRADGTLSVFALDADALAAYCADGAHLPDLEARLGSRAFDITVDVKENPVMLAPPDRTQTVNGDKETGLSVAQLAEAAEIAEAWERAGAAVTLRGRVSVHGVLRAVTVDGRGSGPDPKAANRPPGRDGR